MNLPAHVLSACAQATLSHATGAVSSRPAGLNLEERREWSLAWAAMSSFLMGDRGQSAGAEERECVPVVTPTPAQTFDGSAYIARNFTRISPRNTPPAVRAHGGA